MDKKYVAVSGVIFGVVAVLHAARAVGQWPVHVGTVEFPVWLSWAGMVAAVGLCAWAYRVWTRT